MANRYWVGGGSSVNWNATGNTNWGTASNTQDNASVPGASDDVFFDGVGTGASDCTINASGSCRSLNFTGYANTFSHIQSVTISIGDGTAGASNIALELVAGMTYSKQNTVSSAMSFVSTSGTQQDVTLGGKVLGSTTFNGSGGSWIFTDTFAANGGTATILTLTTGTLNTNGQTVSVGQFVSTGSATRVLTLGASTFNVSSTGSTAFNTATSGLTVNANTSTINMTNGGTFTGSGKTYYNLSYTGSSSGNTTISGSNTFNNFSYTGGANKTNALLLGVSSTQTISGTLTLSGNSISNRSQVSTGTGGSTATLNANAVSLSNIDFRDIIGAGSASPFTGTSLGNAGNNTNITTTTPVTRYWVGDTGNWDAPGEWSDQSGGSSGFTAPLAQDTVIFDGSSFSTTGFTVTANSKYLGKDISFASVTNNPTISFGTLATVIMGDLTFKSGMTISGTQSLAFTGYTTQSLVSDGVILSMAINPGNSSTILNISDNFNSTSSISNNLAGRINLLADTTCTTYVSSSGTATNSFGNGTLTVTSTGTVFQTAGTTIAGNSTIVINNTTSTAKTVAGGGKTYNNIVFSGDNITVTGNNTFNNFAVNNAGLTNGLKLTAGSTQIVSSFSTNGADSSLAILTSTTTSPATLSKASGIVAVDYMNISYSTASGGATWYAGSNSTEGAGNSGWLFSDPVLTYTGPYPVFRNI
jgi:hypothetical protein